MVDGVPEGVDLMRDQGGDRPGDDTSTPRVVLITGNYLRSDRKAGFHWLADAYARLGCEVTMMTVGMSWLSEIRRDHRTRYGLRHRRNQVLDRSGGIGSIVWFTPWHPGNLRLDILNRIATPLYRTYGARNLGESESILRSADVVVFDTGPGLMLVERVRSINPEALLLLRASDDLRAMKQHDVLLETDLKVAPLYDDISVPSAGVQRRYAQFDTVSLDRHGIKKTMFDPAVASPYADMPGRFAAHAVFVGNGFFDYGFLESARRVAPEIAFHIIGPIPDVAAGENVFTYGELPFAQTVPYVVHADIGLHTLAGSDHLSTFSDSLKTRQYSFCRLPILAPRELPMALPGVVAYDLDDGSIRAALTAALAVDRSALPPVDVDDWSDVAERLVRRGVRRRVTSGRLPPARLSGWLESHCV
jgi:2-beta-glucuronyltransferase